MEHVSHHCQRSESSSLAIVYVTLTAREFAACEKGCKGLDVKDYDTLLINRRHAYIQNHCAMPANHTMQSQPSIHPSEKFETILPQHHQSTNYKSLRTTPSLTPGCVVAVVLGVICAIVDEGAAEEVTDDRSLHPNQPGVSQEFVFVVVLVGSEDVVVIVGAGAAVGVCIAVAEEVVVVVGSLHPNHPGVLQVEVVDVLVLVLELVVFSVVVLSSRHPHHPGVLHVSVLVRV